MKNSGPIELSVPKKGPVPNFQFRTKIENSDTSFLKLSGSRTNIPNFKFQRQTLPKLQKSVFSVPKKKPVPKKWEIDPKWIWQFTQLEKSPNNDRLPNLKSKGQKLNEWGLTKVSVPKKGQYPKSGPNMSNMQILSFPGGDTQKSCAQSEFEAERLLTAHSGTQNCPIPVSPFWGKIWNLGPYHLLDIITKEKPAKFQTKRTAGSKVLRLCNFCAPKRVKPPKGPKSGPYGIFQFSRWRYPEIMSTDQIWSETGLNFSI